MNIEKAKSIIGNAITSYRIKCWAKYGERCYCGCHTRIPWNPDITYIGNLSDIEIFYIMRRKTLIASHIPTFRRPYRDDLSDEYYYFTYKVRNLEELKLYLKDPQTLNISISHFLKNYLMNIGDNWISEYLKSKHKYIYFKLPSIFEDILCFKILEFNKSIYAFIDGFVKLGYSVDILKHNLSRMGMLHYFYQYFKNIVYYRNYYYKIQFSLLYFWTVVVRRKMRQFRETESICQNPIYLNYVNSRYCPSLKDLFKKNTYMMQKNHMNISFGKLMIRALDSIENREYLFQITNQKYITNEYNRLLTWLILINNLDTELIACKAINKICRYGNIENPIWIKIILSIDLSNKLQKQILQKIGKVYHKLQLYFLLHKILQINATKNVLLFLLGKIRCKDDLVYKILSMDNLTYMIRENSPKIAKILGVKTLFKLVSKYRIAQAFFCREESVKHLCIQRYKKELVYMLRKTINLVMFIVKLKSKRKKNFEECMICYEDRYIYTLHNDNRHKICGKCYRKLYDIDILPVCPLCRKKLTNSPTFIKMDDRYVSDFGLI